MKNEDLYWAAGFLEGEGYFHCRRYKKDKLGTRSAVEISVSQVQKWPLEKLKAILGGRINGPYERKKGNHQPVHMYFLTGPGARIAMKLLLPLMSPQKSDNIKASLEEWENRTCTHRPWRLKDD